MSPKSVPDIPDRDKTRERLLAELQELRARNAALEQCDARAERLKADLRNNEEMTRHLLEQKLYGVWINVGNKVAYINEVGARILGTSNPGEVVGKTLLELVHPDYQDIVMGRIKAMDRGDSAVPMIEEKYLRVDGMAVDVDVWAMRFIYKGEPAILVAFKDITERKRAEMALRESEAKYRDLVKNANSIIIRWDLKGNLTFINEFAEEFFGYPASEVLGKNVMDTIVPTAESTGRDLVVMIKDIEQHPERYKTNMNENIRRSGERVWISWTNKAIRDTHGNVTEILSVGNDITERKRAEEALSKNLSVLAKSQEIAHLGSWTVDFDSGRFDLSEEIYRMHGLEPGTVEPTLDKSSKLTHPDDRKRYQEYVDLLRREGRLGGIDYRIVWPDGSIHYVHVLTDSVVRGSDGRVKMASGITQDITERKRAEEALKAAKAQAELYLDLMGHDINNIHQIALGYLEMAQDMPPGPMKDEMIEKPIEVLQRSTQLIKNVRKLQKHSDGLFRDNVIDVVKLLSDVHREFDSMPGKAVTLNLNGCDHCRVRADELLHDVFSNLVGNAIKHTGERADILVDLNIVNYHGGRYCQVSVEDNGQGIPDDFKARIFNRGLKGTNKAMGMGLGLYLVKSLVESYGGYVSVEDRVPGDHTKGAKFVVMLPAVDN